MKLLVQARLEKTKREDKINQAVNKVIQGVLSVKEVISSAL